MLRQVSIIDGGDTKFIVGDMISKKRFRAENKKIPYKYYKQKDTTQ